LIPKQERAESHLSDIKKVLEGLEEACETLLENSEKEIEKKSKKTFGRARALNKLARLFIKRMKKVDFPEKVSYDDLEGFVKAVEGVFVVTEVDIRNWFPKISPYFIMDRRRFQGVFEKAKGSLVILRSFLKDEYVKTKTIAETFELINNLQTLEDQLADLETKRNDITQKVASIEERITSIHQKMENLKHQDSLTQIDQINSEMERLEEEVTYNLRHLHKPLLKLERLVHRKGGLTPEESSKLNQYISNSFQAFASEETGYALLKKILQTLNNSFSDNKIKLKASRIAKAKQDIDKILKQGHLDDLHKKCQEIITEKRRLSTSSETQEVTKNLSKLKEDVNELRRKEKRIKLENTNIKRKSDDLLERIFEQKDKIEKNVHEFLDETVIISLRGRSNANKNIGNNQKLPQNPK
jgi:chromosome segregation ATPase